MKKYSVIILLFFNFILIFISGCVPSKPTEKVEILSAERLVNKLEVNRMRIRRFEGNGTLIIKTPQMDNRASFKITLIKPDSLYLTIMGPFGIQLAQALVTNENFIFYDALHNTAYEGAVNQNVIKDIFRVNLPFSDLIDAFVGSVNLTKHLYKSPTKYAVDYDKYVLTYIDSVTHVTTIYRVDIRQLGITSFRVIDKLGDTMLDGKYSDFDYLESVAVPYNINVEDREDDQSVSIQYKKMTANNSDIYIDFQIPKDATIIKW